MKDLIITTKIQVYEIDESNEETKNLIAKAKDVTKNSYSPYSQYAVGAAILLANGEIIAGSNQENAAYPSGLCAERTALFYANSSHPDCTIKAIAITAFYQDDFVKEVCTPCGACRQVIAEIEGKQNSPIKILMCSKNTVYEAESIKSLLPLSFGSRQLSTDSDN